MTWVVRIVALGIKLFGLYYVLKLAHHDNYRGALTWLLFEVILVLIFVSCHIIVEAMLREKRQGSRPWWL
ncbi:MAG TPA: hypothetical protein VIW74_17065 [Pyrinomonadaceae bacterium]|jgi:uncharacterized membrane protein